MKMEIFFATAAIYALIYSLEMGRREKYGMAIVYLIASAISFFSVAGIAFLAPNKL